MKRELRDQKKKEVDKYLHLLKQEDQRYDFESINANKLEHELVKMYRHGAVRWLILNNMKTDIDIYLNNNIRFK